MAGDGLFFNGSGNGCDKFVDLVDGRVCFSIFWIEARVCFDAAILADQVTSTVFNEPHLWP